MNNNRRNALATIREKISDLSEQLQAVLDEEQEDFDNMPEGLQQSEHGEKAENAIGQLQDAISNLYDYECAIEEAEN